MRYALDFQPEDRAHGRVEVASFLDAEFVIQPVGCEWLAECWSCGDLCASENFPTREAAVQACLSAFA